MRALSANEEKLLAQLDNENKAIFEKYVKAQSEVNPMTVAKNFIDGYKLGLLITAEAFITGGELISGEEAYAKMFQVLFRYERPAANGRTVYFSARPGYHSFGFLKAG